jgi:hypothetical protein
MTMCAAALGATCGGCSFIFVTPPPLPPAQPTPRPQAACTSSRVAPVIDGILTGYELFRVGYAAQASDSDYRGLPIDRGTDLALGAGFAALLVTSTIYGVLNTNACQRLKQGPPLGGDLPGITREPEPEQKSAAPAPAEDSIDRDWDATPPQPALRAP